MMRDINPDIYGQYARASLLADYIELIALQGQPVRRSTVADFLSKTDDIWDLGLIRSNESAPLDEESTGSSKQDKARIDARTVFRQIDRATAYKITVPSVRYLGSHRSTLPGYASS